MYEQTGAVEQDHIRGIYTHRWAYSGRGRGYAHPGSRMDARGAINKAGTVTCYNRPVYKALEGQI